MCEYCENMPTRYEGFYVEYYKQTAPDDENEIVIEAKYCPNCGRKVINDSSEEKKNRKLVDDNVLITLTKPYERNFKCGCGCNVFSKYIDSNNKEYYVCHGCDSEYVVE